MHYGEIKNCDIANGVGVRVTLFVSGCTNRCENCFQPETWDFDYGQPFTEETEDKIIEMLRPRYITGFTVLGGEPFEPQNQRALLPLLKRIKEEYPRKTIWAFSGFRYDDEITRAGAHPNCEVTDQLLSLIDVLVDGRFVEKLKDISLVFRGSSNQRIIDLNETRKNGRLTLWDENRASE
jgi:anaerobic ribonucleoside-triphosphate reductase activating protein